MNIGILLTGISYGEKERNWRDAFASIQEMVIQPYNKEHDTFVYLTTYHHYTNRLLLHDYRPVKSTFLSLNGSSPRLTYRESLGLLAGEKLDFIIATRFDIRFNSPIIEMELDYGKFNVLFREEGFWIPEYEYTCDNLFAFPAKYLDVFRQSIAELYVHKGGDLPGRTGCQDLHGAYKLVKDKLGDEHMHFIWEGEWQSANNPFYTLLRKANG